MLISNSFEIYYMDEKHNAKNIYFKMLDLLKQNIPCVLCTVTVTQGSTPQKPGSSALFGENGLILGTVGGGVVEHSIEKEAAFAIRSKESGQYFFDLVNDISNEEAAICGGGMSILLDAAPEEHFTLFAEIRETINNGISGVLITSVITTEDDHTKIQRMWITQSDIKDGLYGLKGTIADAAKDMLNKSDRDDFREFMVKKEGAKEKQIVILESILPMPKLLIAGAGHVGKALAGFAKKLDFNIMVWDERKDFANKKNFPDVSKIYTGKMNRKPRNFFVDRNTFIVIVTPGHKNDVDVLKTFIGSNSGYIGMIGSKSKIKQVKNKFFKNGWANQKQWNKIYTPIGLDIHSKTVNEIAVSIAAELIKVRYELNHNG